MEQTTLKQLLKYDPLTGEFTWRTGTHKGKTHLGVFSCPEAASTAYMMAKEFYFGNC